MGEGITTNEKKKNLTNFREMEVVKLRKQNGKYLQRGMPGI